MGRTLDIVLTALIPLVLVTAAGFSEALYAYPTPVDFDGTLLRWSIDPSSAPITYETSADREEDDYVYGAAIDEAAALWSDVPTSYFAFLRAPEGEAADVTIHLQNALDGAPYSSGYAIFDEIEEGHGPKHCSIYVAVGETSYESLAKTVLHELGHCAGLGHSLIPEAIMSYRLSQNAFVLDLDDEAAITRLYPADGSAPKLPPGCATGGAHRAPTFLLVLALLMPLCAVLQGTLTPSEESDQGP